MGKKFRIQFTHSVDKEEVVEADSEVKAKQKLKNGMDGAITVNSVNLDSVTDVESRLSKLIRRAKEDGATDTEIQNAINNAESSGGLDPSQ